MFGRISQHLREQLGSDDVTLISADVDGDNLLLYSNRRLNGYKKRDGMYFKQTPLKEIPEDEMNRLKYRGAKFYGPTKRGTQSYPDGQSISLIVFRSPHPDEEGVLASGTSYGYCMTFNAARTMSWFAARGDPSLDFSAEGILAHEGAHGINYLVIDQLEDLFGYTDELRVVDETVAQLVGIKFMERFIPEEAEAYKALIREPEPENGDAIFVGCGDPVHSEAFRIVLKERERAEEMRKLVNMLVENRYPAGFIERMLRRVGF